MVPSDTSWVAFKNENENEKTLMVTQWSIASRIRHPSPQELLSHALGCCLLGTFPKGGNRPKIMLAQRHLRFTQRLVFLGSRVTSILHSNGSVWEWLDRLLFVFNFIIVIHFRTYLIFGFFTTKSRFFACLYTERYFRYFTSIAGQPSLVKAVKFNFFINFSVDKSRKNSTTAHRFQQSRYIFWHFFVTVI